MSFLMIRNALSDGIQSIIKVKELIKIKKGEVEDNEESLNG